MCELPEVGTAVWDQSSFAPVCVVHEPWTGWKFNSIYNVQDCGSGWVSIFANGTCYSVTEREGQSPFCRVGSAWGMWIAPNRIKVFGWGS